MEVSGQRGGIYKAFSRCFLGAGGARKLALKGLLFSLSFSGTARWVVDRHGTPSAAPKLTLSLGAAPEDLGQDLEKA